MNKPLRRDATPLLPSVFAEAVAVGLSAGHASEGGAVTLDQPAPGGAVSVLEVPDSPYSRAAFALKRHFAADDALFASAFARFRALMDLFSRGALSDWSRSREGGRSALHPAVIDVASRMRLSDNGRFAPRKFQAAVAEAARTSYPDLDDWG